MELEIYKAGSIKEAVALGGPYRAGATDLIALHRVGIRQEKFTDIFDIDELKQIEILPDGTTRVGALVTIEALAAHGLIEGRYPGLAKTAVGLGTPQIRSQGTIGGNLLQHSRCPYYRNPRFECFKKGGSDCPARSGQHVRGVCFDLGACVAPHPSSIGMALLAYQASLEVADTEELLSIESLYGDASNPAIHHILQPGQLLTHIVLPPPFQNEQAAYIRAIGRDEAEWPLVEVMVRAEILHETIEQVHIGLGSVAPIPMTASLVENALKGREITQSILEAASKKAGVGANPLPMTNYKVRLLENTVLAALQEALM